MGENETNSKMSIWDRIGWAFFASLWLALVMPLTVVWIKLPVGHPLTDEIQFAGLALCFIPAFIVIGMAAES
jgi:hypothetical protein